MQDGCLYKQTVKHGLEFRQYYRFSQDAKRHGTGSRECPSSNGPTRVIEGAGYKRYREEGVCLKSGMSSVRLVPGQMQQQTRRKIVALSM